MGSIVGRSRRGSRRRMTLAAAFALAAAFVLVVGATASPTGRTKATAGTLTWAIQTNPASLFDAYYFSAEGSQIFSLVQDHILAPGTFGQPKTGEGSVASSWKAVNATTYTYTIKQGVKFSDGSTLTAKDVAFTMNVHRDKKTGSKMADFFGNVRSIAAKGNVVTVKLLKPDSNWQYTPAASPGLVYSQADYQKKGASFGTPSGMPIGTGPYMFSSFEPNSRVVLTRNPYYKGKKYPWDRIVFPLIPDEQARLLALQSGQIDGTFAVPNNSISTWVKAPGLKVGTYVSGGWRGFSLDVEDGPFQDVHVRRAIAYSLDEAGINEALTSSRGKVLVGLPPLIFIKALLPAKEIDAALKKVPTYDYSVTKAKAELAQSAYPKGFSTTLNVPTGCPACLLLSQTLSAGASKIGIDINLNIMPGPQRFQVILDHKPHLGIQVLGQAPDSPHPMQYLDLLYTSSHAAPGYENSANYKNATVDKLIQQGLQTPDLKVAARNALKVMQIVARDVPYIPVFMFPGAWGVKSGWEFNSALGPFFYNQIWLSHLVAK
jgi:peptide/nickel transport system substrate-binding protein